MDTDNVCLGELRSMAAQWRTSLKRIGEILAQARSQGEPVDIWRKEILKDEFGMSMATSEAAEKWAAGELGEDAKAQAIISKVKHSIVCKFTPEIAERVCTGRHTIYSRTLKRVVDKSLAEMDRDEVNDNIDVQGFRPLDRTQRSKPSFRYCKATRIETGENGEVFVVHDGEEIVRMQLTKKLLAELGKIVGNSRKREAACV